jgi:hypothetical protein
MTETMGSSYTPWYSSEIDPLQVGAYQISGGWFACFDGAYWFESSPTPEEAVKMIAPRSQAHFYWRGLTFDAWLSEMGVDPPDARAIAEWLK